jgi:hypothetical protein
MLGRRQPFGNKTNDNSDISALDHAQMSEISLFKDLSSPRGREEEERGPINLEFQYKTSGR